MSQNDLPPSPPRCERCGGQKAVYLKVEPTWSNAWTAYALSISNSSMHLCMCPMDAPKKKERHDGRIGEYTQAYYNQIWPLSGGNPTDGIRLSSPSGYYPLTY